MPNKHVKYVLALIVLSYFFFIFGNGIVSLTNPDEVFYAGTAKEMIQQKSWMTPYLFGQPQFEKPIFLYWLLRISFNVFGQTPFAARFPAAIFALLGVLAVYILGFLGFKNHKKAFISGIIIMSCGFYIGMARTVFTDMIFSVLILFSMAAFYWGYSNSEKRGQGIILFFIFAGLAVLTKGPLGIILPLLSVGIFLWIKKDLKILLSKSTVWGALLFLLIALPWYWLMIAKYGNTFTHEFFYNDHVRRLLEAEHKANDTWYFYPFSMIGCIFPWSIFVAVSLYYLARNIKKAKPIHLYFASWISVVLVVFQGAHSKLISYILPLFPALALVAGDFIHDIAFLENRSRFFRRLVWINLAVFIVLPVGAYIALGKFPGYLSSNLPVYAFIAAFCFLIIMIFAYLRKSKFFMVVYLFSLTVPMFLLPIPFIYHDIEPYLSSERITRHLIENYKVDNTILCSKFFARGVRYYTGNEVAVMSSPNNNYFSPHPILFFVDDNALREFLRQQKVTYCILKRSAAADMFERVAAKEFKVAELYKLGDEHLLRVELIK